MMREVLLQKETGRVFVSYSWDSEEHRDWVLKFVYRLRQHGIDAFNDQTELALGARIPEFMERSVRESGRVLVICTEVYRQRFDNREGGAGYESNIITGEIVNEVGENKFIPILRSGKWNSAIPTALLGTNGVDLRNDSEDEFRKLVESLHHISRISPIGQPPEWVRGKSKAFGFIDSSKDVKAGPQQYWEQRGKVAETELMSRIWPKARWEIWIYPTEFRTARFRNVEDCRSFMQSSRLRVQGRGWYPSFLPDKIEMTSEWISGEAEGRQNGFDLLERWLLYRSGQFVHHRTLGERPELGDRIHVLEILFTVTGAFEFGARMASRGILVPEAVVRVELWGVDGRALSWPQDLYPENDLVGQNCWCQEKTVRVVNQIANAEFTAKRRELSLATVLEIYSKFGWSEPFKDRLIDAQSEAFGIS